MPRRTTMFSWGYDGWGNATKQFVKAVDAVEESRGFESPLFVDIRVNRFVRAKGFNGGAFEKLVGRRRYRWMKSLGNVRIESGEGRFIQIAEPKAAAELLDLGLEAAEVGRRVIFFCHCPSPKVDGRMGCHRRTVSTLLTRRAKREDTSLEVVEWPGTRPSRIEVRLKPDMFEKLKRGRRSIPVGKRIDLAEMAGLGVGTIATVHCGDEQVYRLVGPVRRQAGEWMLPVLDGFENATSLSEYRAEAKRLRHLQGLEPLTA